MAKRIFYFLLALTTTACFTACSDDEELTGKSALCHAWYFHDEMPKNYASMLVFTPDGRVEGAELFYETAHKLSKNIYSHGRYTVEGDLLTIEWEGAEAIGEPAIQRVYVIEKSAEGYTMYLYSVDEKNKTFNSDWFWGFYTASAEQDQMYRNAAVYKAHNCTNGQ